MLQKVTPSVAARELLRRKRAAESLVDYSKSIIIPGKPVDDTDDVESWVFHPVETGIAKHHVLIMGACQQVFEGAIKNLMLLLPPGSAKSTYASVVFPTWAMGKKQATQIILSSYGSDLAKKHGRRARQIVSSIDYQAIFETTISKRTQAADFWTLENGSEYMSCGILSGITGNRADGVVLDDPIKGRAEADSETIRNKTWEAYREDLLTRLKPGGWQIIILTRWHEDDPVGRILPENYDGGSGWFKSRADGEPWYVLCCPAECERTDDPLGRKIGELLWPEWFKGDHFQKFKAVPRTWNALFQQRPSPEEGTFFKRDWFELYDPEKKPTNVYYYGASDYAVTDDAGDFTAHGIFGIDPDTDLWLLDWWDGQTSADVWIERQLDLVAKYKPFVWFGEGGVIRRAIEPFLKRRMLEREVYFHPEWIPSIKDKPTRARGIQGRAALGKVHIPDNEWGRRIVEQLMKFPAGKYDDAVDVLSLMGQVLDQAHPSLQIPKKEYLSFHDKRIDALKRGDTSSFEHIATIEQERELHRFGWDPDADFDEVEYREDGNLKPTIT